MQVFVTKWVSRFVRREGIGAESLVEAVARAERGLIDADLGGGLIKQRIARQGKGRSGGYRTLIAYRRGDRAVFVYGFAKSERENIEPEQLKAAQKVALRVLGLDKKGLVRAERDGEIEEVVYGRKKEEPVN